MQKRRKEGIQLILKARVDSKVGNWINNMTGYGDKSNVTSKALEFYYLYQFNKKGFFVRLIDLHFSDIKRLLRYIGRQRREAQKESGEY